MPLSVNWLSHEFVINTQYFILNFILFIRIFNIILFKFLLLFVLLSFNIIVVNLSQKTPTLLSGGCLAYNFRWPGSWIKKERLLNGCLA